MTRKFGWSKNVLIHHIENQSYEKSLTGQNNFDKALTPEIRAQAKLAWIPTDLYSAKNLHGGGPMMTGDSAVGLRQTVDPTEAIRKSS